MSIFYTDTYTVGADTPITQYPSAGAPNYEILLNGTVVASVIAATGRVEMISADPVECALRLNVLVPTTDYRVTATCGRGAGYVGGIPLVRCGAAFGGDYYAPFISASNTWEMYRYNVGVGTVISTGTFTAPDSASALVRFEVGGTNPVVLTFTYGLNTPIVINDSDAARLQTGGPGIDMYRDGGLQSDAWLDDLQVDDTKYGIVWRPNRMGALLRM